MSKSKDGLSVHLKITPQLTSHWILTLFMFAGKSEWHLFCFFHLLEDYLLEKIYANIICNHFRIHLNASRSSVALMIQIQFKVVVVTFKTKLLTGLSLPSCFYPPNPFQQEGSAAGIANQEVSAGRTMLPFLLWWLLPGAASLWIIGWPLAGL